MADLIFRGVKNPANCSECFFWPVCPCLADFDDYSAILDAVHDGNLVRHEKCPLVSLPEGHGRLGDLDALFEKMYHLSDNEGAHKDSHVDDDLILRDSACYLIEKATTIIEADLEWKMKNCCCFSNTDQAEGGGEDG